MRQSTDHSRRHAVTDILRAAGIGHGTWARSATLRAAAEPAEDGAISWVLTTELPALVWDWERWELVNEVLIAEGMLTPAIGQVPLLDSHNRNSALDVLGHVRDFSQETVGSYPGNIGNVRFAADETSQVIRQKVIDRHITDGSVGYQVSKSLWIPEGMTVTVAGRNWTGPLKVSSEWSLREFSITPIGADVLAKVRRLCGGR